MMYLKLIIPSLKMSQTNWNPNLLATQPQSESSDFDSSDSEHDSLDEAGPSTAIPTLLAKRSPTPPVLSNAVLSNAVHFDDKAVTRPPPPTIPGPGLGGALRRRGDGEAMQPRLVKRARKKVSCPAQFSRRRTHGLR